MGEDPSPPRGASVRRSREEKRSDAPAPREKGDGCDYGIAALARLASPSDAEVRQIAGQLDELPAGQALGVVVAVVSVVFIALFVTELPGIAKLFPFVEPL